MKLNSNPCTYKHFRFNKSLIVCLFVYLLRFKMLYWMPKREERHHLLSKFIDAFIMLCPYENFVVSKKGKVFRDGPVTKRTSERKIFMMGLNCAMRRGRMETAVNCSWKWKDRFLIFRTQLCHWWHCCSVGTFSVNKSNNNVVLFALQFYVFVQ